MSLMHHNKVNNSTLTPLWIVLLTNASIAATNQLCYNPSIYPSIQPQVSIYQAQPLHPSIDHSLTHLISYHIISNLNNITHNNDKERIWKRLHSRHFQTYSSIYLNFDRSASFNALHLSLSVCLQ
jgi:hypothetical protein